MPEIRLYAALQLRLSADYSPPIRFPERPQKRIRISAKRLVVGNFIHLYARRLDVGNFIHLYVRRLVVGNLIHLYANRLFAGNIYFLYATFQPGFKPHIRHLSCPGDAIWKATVPAYMWDGKLADSSNPFIFQHLSAGCLDRILKLSGWSFLQLLIQNNLCRNGFDRALTEDFVAAEGSPPRTLKAHTES